MTLSGRPARFERFRFRSEGALLQKAAELGIALPWSEEIGILFDGIEIGGSRLSNRLSIHPLEAADAEADGSPGLLTFRRYERFGAGGCGLIWFEAAAVTKEGRSNPHQLRIGRENLDGFKRLAERTRSAAEKAGTGPPPFLILQLTHSGRMSRPFGAAAPVIARRDPRLDALYGLPADYPLITDEALGRLNDDFRRAAALALEAGFDGVDVKACHGYLAAELLAARNRTESRYGGPFENRARFLLETVRAIRAEAPGLLLACRLGVYDSIPGGFGVDEGDAAAEDMAEPMRLAALLAEAGVGLLNISAGVPADRPYFGRPFDIPAAGGAPAGEHPLASLARLIRLAAAIQKSSPALPVVGTGYSWLRQLFPRAAAGVLNSGGAALIGLGRLAFACPDFAGRLAARGRLGSNEVCTTCSGCSTLLRAARPAGCVVRDSGVYRPI
jgi:2,4-dienoyl-CoA reductase-like NADH-dependent reductase (Old Yellow Enzyme family)